MHTPKNEAMLIERARALAGSTLAEVCHQVKQPLPDNLHTKKGFVGQLMELALGADAKNLDQPDFLHLGIELKTLPIDAKGSPLESTYICYANFPPTELHWQGSRVQRKTAKILWVPYLGDKNVALANRRIGQPFLWQPSVQVAEQLQTDYEELTDYMIKGLYSELDARKGKYIQLRPKAANGQTLITVFNEYGDPTQIVPKGFYFRSQFTKMILADVFALG